MNKFSEIRITGPCAGVEVSKLNSTGHSQNMIEVSWTMAASHLSAILFYKIEGQAEGDQWRLLVSRLPEHRSLIVLAATGEDRGRRRTTLTDFGSNISYR
ncbi:hypothetical protein Ciccas_003271 [Cichlidogyrus casuarinus]|uniref:Uncharacterized protein n=1 Tax=Cichlidogyrus casuarinus TaxID=1844966 RepID=A0ABD2QF97_9PLAT